MDSKKLRDKLHEIETQNGAAAASELRLTDPTDSPSKAKKWRRNVMELKSKKRRVSRKSKIPKSRDKQVHTDESKTVSVARKRRTRPSDLFDDIEAEISVKERAQRTLDQLGYELPHFAKCMLPSNVAHGFWLHLPKKFCTLHLPNHDTSITLVDEWGNEYRTSYLLERHGLSAGWRGFSISHRLLKGDILLFHLVAPCKLRVHIVRVHDWDVVGAAICLVDMNASAQVKKDKRKRKKPQYVEPFRLDIPAPLESGKGKDAPSPEDATEPDASQSGSKSDDLSSEDVKGNEVRNQAKSNNKLCYAETSFLRDHSREGVTCM